MACFAERRRAAIGRAGCRSRTVEIPSGPEFDGVEIRIEEVVPGIVSLLDMMPQVAMNVREKPVEAK